MKLLDGYAKVILHRTTDHPYVNIYYETKKQLATIIVVDIQTDGISPKFFGGSFTVSALSNSFEFDKGTGGTVYCCILTGCNVRAGDG